MLFRPPSQSRLYFAVTNWHKKVNYFGFYRSVVGRISPAVKIVPL